MGMTETAVSSAAVRVGYGVCRDTNNPTKFLEATPTRLLSEPLAGVAVTAASAADQNFYMQSMGEVPSSLLGGVENGTRTYARLGRKWPSGTPDASRTGAYWGSG